MAGAAALGEAVHEAHDHGAELLELGEEAGLDGEGVRVGRVEGVRDVQRARAGELERLARELGDGERLQRGAEVPQGAADGGLRRRRRREQRARQRRDGGERRPQRRVRVVRLHPEVEVRQQQRELEKVETRVRGRRGGLAEVGGGVVRGGGGARGGFQGADWWGAEGRLRGDGGVGESEAWDGGLAGHRGWWERR